jgi:very-short-patch-repair endonuclease
VDWPDIARRQGGAISREQLTAAGLGERQISRMVARGSFERHALGVFVACGAPVTYRTRLWIAVLGCCGALSFGTAAHLHGFDERPDVVDVVVSIESRLRRPFGVRLHRVFVPDSALGTRDGLPVTAPVWTLLDHLGRLPRPAAIRLADRAFQRGWLAPADIAGRLREYPSRQGNAMLRRILATAGDGAAAESERVLHRLLRTAGITGWQANHRVTDRGRIVAVVDVALVHRRVAIEIDGMAFHVDVDRFQRDRQRQNALVALGWTVLRFTWADLTERPGYVIAAIRQAL